MKAIHKDILRLAIPSILANITVPVVGMVDIAVTGHLSGAVAASIGGISIGSMLFDLLYWNFAFLRAGTGGLTAQAYGRADMQECGRILCRGLGLSLLMAALVLAIQWPFTRLAFLVVDSSAEVRELALQYYFIRVWAAPATLSLMTLRGWFIGMQDTVSSMWTDLVVNGMNILASVVLALGIGGWPGLGFKGVAYGTLVAQYSGLLFALGVLAVKYWKKVLPQISLRQAVESFRGNDLKGFFSMNADLFLRSVGFILIYIGFTVISARFGDLMLASSAIMMKLLMLFSFFTDGFAYAGQALTGKFIGERNPGGLQETVKAVFNWSMGVAVLFIGIYGALGVPLLRIMTSDGQVVEACRQFLPWLIAMPPLGCAAFTWDGIYEGATASRPIRDAMLAAALLFFLTWFGGKAVLDHFSPESYQAAALHVLLGAYFMHLLTRTVWLSATYRKSIFIK
ncbi:MAG: MATE family efflux transporter [Bacteroidales bacterium]|nr:MATE family efflux transporter [Bacteroidales bacterium]